MPVDPAAADAHPRGQLARSRSAPGRPGWYPWPPRSRRRVARVRARPGPAAWLARLPGCVARNWPARTARPSCAAPTTPRNPATVPATTSHVARFIGMLPICALVSEPLARPVIARTASWWIGLLRDTPSVPRRSVDDGGDEIPPGRRRRRRALRRRARAGGSVTGVEAALHAASRSARGAVPPRCFDQCADISAPVHEVRRSTARMHDHRRRLRRGRSSSSARSGVTPTPAATSRTRARTGRDG